MKINKKIRYTTYYLAPFVFNTLFAVVMWSLCTERTLPFTALVWFLLVVCNMIWAHFTLNPSKGELQTPFLAVCSHWYGYTMVLLAQQPTPVIRFNEWIIGIATFFSSIVLFIVCTIASNWRKHNPYADFSVKSIGKAPRRIVIAVVLLPLLFGLANCAYEAYYRNQPYKQADAFKRVFYFRADAAKPLGKNESNQYLYSLDGFSEKDFVYVHLGDGLGNPSEKGVIYQRSDTKLEWKDFTPKSLSVVLDGKRIVIRDTKVLESLVDHIGDNSNRLLKPNTEKPERIILSAGEGEWLEDTGNAALYFDLPCNLYMMPIIEIAKDKRVFLQFARESEYYYYDVTHILGEYLL